MVQFNFDYSGIFHYLPMFIFKLVYRYCLSRPQINYTCGITGITCVWNYLNSWLGVGDKQPISTEEALHIVGIYPPYDLVPFPDFTENETLEDWYSKLNTFFGIKGNCKTLFKLHGDNKTTNTSEEALAELKEGLRNEKKAYIYHCENHFCLLIGYESNPILPIEALRKAEELTSTEEWIIIGEYSKIWTPFHVKKWSDVVLDLDQQYPNYYSIRHPENGIMVRNEIEASESKKTEINSHCIIEFSLE
jgi:hypothetical protein